MTIKTIDYRTINRLQRGQLIKRKRLILAACKFWQVKRKRIEEACSYVERLN